ncbi:hypothetical protein JJL45_00340 [Tamlana sp. s12]|uniref:hypothetical protein n=1 Tax=Tamlana sp. s12 TaxID=1630406 RepID=UPI0008016ABD|nr:hypothetical protein [Tamlana sp. s12]OBQ57325.1 hypothetical protein VQ01_02325 [Tamlana sp. s12]QQY82475.1 hypothetical protein JJL45_00340 [Tamlana sp. s12]
MKNSLFILVIVAITGVVALIVPYSNKLENTTLSFNSQTIPSTLKNTISSKKKKTLLVGDSLISDRNFINQINATCISNGDLEISDTYKSKCNFFKIKFIYENLNSIDDKEIQNFNNISYHIRQSKETSDADNFIIKNLILKKGDVFTDSIRIYSYENYIEALVQKNKYFYLEGNYLWILKFNIDEAGVNVVDWSSYIVNDSGKIILEEN